MILIFLLLTISFDILLFKILTYKKKDEKEYFYKVNKELEKNFIKNCPYKGTVYFNSEFIPNILIKNGGEIIICPTGTNVNEYQKIDFSKENIIRRNNCKISLNDDIIDIIFKEYKYKIECQKCGKYFFRQRYNKNLTRHYRCGICGGKLKAVKVR